MFPKNQSPFALTSHCQAFAFSLPKHLYVIVMCCTHYRWWRWNKFSFYISLWNGQAWSVLHSKFYLLTYGTEIMFFITTIFAVGYWWWQCVDMAPVKKANNEFTFNLILFCDSRIFFKLDHFFKFKHLIYKLFFS